MLGGAMGTKYSQLSLDDRIEIYRLLASGLSLRRIALAIRRSASTITREVRRNSRPTKQFSGGYQPARADQLAARRRRWDKRHKMQRQPALRDHVRDRLAMGWSPQQISGRLARNNAPMRISHESIYRYIYYRANQRDPWHHLLSKKKNRRGRFKRNGRSPLNTIQQRRPIAERPDAANERMQPGHWEADLIMFAKPGRCLLILYERLSRYIMLRHVANKSADAVHAKIARICNTMPDNLRRTFTFDNGFEFMHHHRLIDRYGVETFFCDPNAPWQKGGVENAVGRLRRWLPTKTEINHVQPSTLARLARRNNDTPRKCLGYETPNEIFRRVALQS